MATLSPIQKRNLQKILQDPVLWAQSFLIIYNPKTKREEPWHARWYQAEMLRDKSIKKVYRCGRRTGKLFLARVAVNCGKVLKA